MNLKWVKQHWPSLAAVVLFVVVLAGIVYLERKARAAIRQVESELEAQQRELEELRRKEPFPSRENLEAIKRDYEQMRQLHEALFASLTRATVPATELSPIAFSQLLAQRLSRLRQQAIQARVGIPEGFAFGFGRYVAALPCTRLPEKECKAVMQQLGKQLAAVEWLAQLLISAPVDEIRAIRRLEVEPSGPGTDAVSVSPVSERDSLYHTLPFELEFVCEEPALRKVLNELVRAEWLFTIRRLSIGSGSDSSAQLGGKPGVETVVSSAGGRARLSVGVALDLVEIRPVGAAASGSRE